MTTHKHVEELCKGGNILKLFVGQPCLILCYFCRFRLLQKLIIKIIFYSSSSSSSYYYYYRTPRAVVNGETSEWAPVLSGAPQ